MQVSGQEDDHDTGDQGTGHHDTGQHGEGSGHNVSIFEELRESENSPERGEKIKKSPICGAPTVHRSLRPRTATKITSKSKKPVISVTVRTPRMRDFNKRSNPSTKVPVKLPFQATESRKEGNI